MPYRLSTLQGGTNKRGRIIYSISEVKLGRGNLLVVRQVDLLREVVEGEMLIEERGVAAMGEVGEGKEFIAVDVIGKTMTMTSNSTMVTITLTNTTIRSSTITVTIKCMEIEEVMGISKVAGDIIRDIMIRGVGGVTGEGIIGEVGIMSMGRDIIKVEMDIMSNMGISSGVVDIKTIVWIEELMGRRLMNIKKNMTGKGAAQGKVRKKVNQGVLGALR